LTWVNWPTRRLTSDSNHDRDFGRIFDVRNSLKLLGSVGVLREMAAKPIFNPGERRANVTSHLLTNGLDQLFQATHDWPGLGDALRAFHNAEHAMRDASSSTAPSDGHQQRLDV
jgi:hypothetical protein